MPEPVTQGEQAPAIRTPEGLVFPVEIGHVGEHIGQTVIAGLPQARALGTLQVAQPPREVELGFG